MTELFELTALEARDLLKKGDIAPVDMVEASLQRMADLDGSLNAMPIQCADRALEQAATIDVEGSALGGLPVAIKDLQEVAGVRTTWGSPLFKDHVSEISEISVERMETEGGIPIGKSNTPEFGAGANTFNEVFGKTRNPYDTRLTCGGSSGGSAVALATGMVPLANGSDLAGSLRTPASFCGIVGMRPSSGVVARRSKTSAFSYLSVEGPMARTVTDLALLLDVMAGTHTEDPISRPSPASPYLQTTLNGGPPQRIAWSQDLGFVAPDAEIREVCEAALTHFHDMGTTVTESTLDFSDTKWIFQRLRAELFVGGHQEKLAEHRDQLKADIIWNIEAGQKMTVGDIGEAEAARSRLQRRVAQFFQNHDLLVSPTALVPPFDVDQIYVTEANGVHFDNYVDWLGLAYAVSTVGCPAISIPCGFTKSGLPVGIQLIGPPHGDAKLLAFAHHFQQATGISTRPITPNVTHL